MFNSVVLEVVIGLVFIFLLYSLLATIIEEMIAVVFDFRAKILQRAIVRMLEDRDHFKSRFTSLLHLFYSGVDIAPKNTPSYDFYNHPLIKFLGENRRHRMPDYIDKVTFSKVMTDLLRGDQVGPADDVRQLIQQTMHDKKIKWGTSSLGHETHSFLKSIWADSKGDIGKFRGLLENWFDETMLRTTGWYKRHTQFILFFIGLAISILFNVNTIGIVNKLERDPRVREQLISQAEAISRAYPLPDRDKRRQDAAGMSTESLNTKGSVNPKETTKPVELASYDSIRAYQEYLFAQADKLIRTDMEKSNGLLGLGWRNGHGIQHDFPYVIHLLVGWLISALAISLGAPFWFDLLNKLLKLRNSALKKEP